MSTAKTTRRTLLLSGGAVVLAGAVGAGVALSRSEIGLVKARVRGQLPDLVMAEDELDFFAEDFLEFYRRRTAQYGSRVDKEILLERGLSVLPGMRELPVWPGQVAVAMERFDREVRESFFMSTDYLLARKTPGQEAFYLSINDPYLAGCANPLAQFDTA